MYVESASEEELALAYQACVALISASVAEGYGIPIVEAAIHGKPAIVSDIPVFREIGGEGVKYFSLQDSQALSDAILFFCDLSKSERHAMAARIEVFSWEESAMRLLEILYSSNHYMTLRPMINEI
jgi:glycosyltransferase involved in cell wall biosynthesis